MWQRHIYLWDNVWDINGIIWLIINRYSVWSIISGWWLTYPSEKYARQLGWWHSQYMENKNVPNHKPVISIGLTVENNKIKGLASSWLDSTNWLLFGCYIYCWFLLLNSLWNSPIHLCLILLGSNPRFSCSSVFLSGCELHFCSLQLWPN